MLKEKLGNDFKQALKRKEEIKVSVLRMLKAEILNREQEKRYSLVKEKTDLNNKELEEQSSLGDKEILEVIFSKIKMARGAIIEFEKGKRDDLVEKEKKEIEILKKYLPEQLSEKKIREIGKKAVKKTGAKNLQDMGKVMAMVMPEIKGRAEGAQVSKIIRELLS